MLKIISNLKNYKKAVAMIIVLLIVQATCDLALPNYTSSLIDVGMQNKGIEYSVPEDMTAQGYKAVQLLMTQSEQADWQKAYEKNSDGTYSLKAGTDIEALDKEFTEPIAIYYMVSQADKSAFSKGASFSSSSFDMGNIDFLSIIKEKNLTQKDFSTLINAVTPAINWPAVSKKYKLNEETVLPLLKKLNLSALAGQSSGGNAAAGLTGLIDFSKVDPAVLTAFLGIDSKNPDIAGLLKKLNLTDEDIHALAALMKPALNMKEISKEFGLSEDAVILLLDSLNTETLGKLPNLMNGKTDITTLLDFSKIDYDTLFKEVDFSNTDFSAMASSMTDAQKTALLEAVIPAIDRAELSRQTGISVSVINTVLDDTDPATLAKLINTAGGSSLGVSELKDCIDYEKIDYATLIKVMGTSSSGFDMSSVFSGSKYTDAQKKILINAVLPAVNWDKVAEKTGIPAVLLKLGVNVLGADALINLMSGSSGSGMSSADFSDCIDYSKVDYKAVMSVIGTDASGMDFSSLFSSSSLSDADKAKVIGAVLPAVNAQKLSQKTGIPAHVITAVLKGVDAKTMVKLMSSGLDPSLFTNCIDYSKINYTKLFKALNGSKALSGSSALLTGMTDKQLKAAITAVLPAMKWDAVKKQTGFDESTIRGLLGSVTATTLKKLSSLGSGSLNTDALAGFIDSSKLDTAALGKILDIDAGALLAQSGMTDKELQKALLSLCAAVDWKTVEKTYGISEADALSLLKPMTVKSLSSLLSDFTGSKQPDLTALMNTEKVDFSAILSALRIDTSSIEALINTLPESLLPAFRNAIFPVREQMNKKVAALGESILHSSAVAFVISEYTKLGKDVNAIQSAYLWLSGLKMLVMTLISAAASVAVGFLATRTGAGVGRDLREKVFNRVIRFASNDIDKFSTASLITRSTNDIQQVQFVTSIMLRLLLYAPVLSIGGIIMVARTGANMWWVVAVAIAVILSVMGALVAITMPKFKSMQTLIDKVNLVSREILTGLPVIRAFGREKEEEDRFDNSNKALTKTMLFTNRMMSMMFPLLMMAMFTLAVSIVWISAINIDKGSLQVGAMTAFITYALMIVMGFLMLTAMSIMLPRAGVAASRIDEVIKTEPSIKDPEMPEAIADKKGVVTFNHVSFAYPGAEENTLTDISFTAFPGQTTAIIGSTGCGKSTLVNLIPRFYDVTSGEVDIDGKDIRKLTQNDLRSMIGYVPQKGVLFSGTIAYNLRFGAENTSDEEMRLAAEIAQAADFIGQKEETYESAVAQGGSNVSGGQKQRLSIARAIAKDPKIYIFDDSFSALDFKTDVALRKALAPKVADRTVIIVAQRISTVLHADQIVVLDDGTVAGKGSHRQLMETCEVYRQIAQSQLSAKELDNSLDESAKGREL